LYAAEVEIEIEGVKKNVSKFADENAELQPLLLDLKTDEGEDLLSTFSVFGYCSIQ